MVVFEEQRGAARPPSVIRKRYEDRPIIEPPAISQVPLATSASITGSMTEKFNPRLRASSRRSALPRSAAP